MLLLVIDGWFNGITATFSFLLGSILGVGIIYQASKINARLLLLMGVNILISSFIWFELTCDFFSIIITNNNLPNPNGFLGPFHLMWGSLAFLMSLYIGAELFSLKKKMYIIIPFLILIVVYQIIIFIDPMESFDFVEPAFPGDDVIHTNFVRIGIAFILNYLFVISGLIFLGFGYLIKSIRSEGIIRKKFLLLSLGYILFVVFPILGIFIEGYFDYFLRIGMASSFFFFYFGLREEPAEKEKKQRVKKKLQVRESLFRLYERPLQITEAEVTFHRERKICLVCKGDVSRLNYICPKCNALYCNNCSEELSNMENSCWVCNEPFDESKPTKPFKRIKDDLEGDIPRKT
ncbi:MAG: hypothetical protein ACFFE4_06205 [Candidatus Thorarchaeota archaeon]